MKQLFLVFFVFSLCNLVHASDCIQRYIGGDVETLKFCVGDKIFLPNSETTEHFFGSIIGFEKKDEHDDHISPVVQFEDGSTELVLNEIMPAKLTSDCKRFESTLVCKNDVVGIGMHKVKVFALARLPSRWSSGLWGVVVDGPEKGEIKYSENIVTIEGDIPEFNNLKLGQSIPNAFGSFDIIQFYKKPLMCSEVPGYCGYKQQVYRKAEFGVFLGETNRVVYMDKKSLEFRLSQQLVKKISFSNAGIQTILVDKTNVSKEKLKERLMNDLFLTKIIISKCREYFPYGMDKISSTKINLDILPIRSPLDDIKLSPGKGFKGYTVFYKYKVTLTCEHSMNQ